MSAKTTWLQFALMLTYIDNVYRSKSKGHKYVCI